MSQTPQLESVWLNKSGAFGLVKASILAYTPTKAAHSGKINK